MNDTMNEITAFSPFGGRLVLEEVKGAQERANVPENSIETKAGDDRSMYVYVPASGCPDAKQTQVVMFLRDGADEASAQAAMKEYGLDALAEKEHFVLAFPNPRQSGWSERDAEDMDYLSRCFMVVMAALEKTSLIDKVKATMFNMASKGGYRNYILLLIVVMLGASVMSGTGYYVLVLSLVSTIPYNKNLPISKIFMPLGYATYNPIVPVNMAFYVGLVASLLESSGVTGTAVPLLVYSGIKLVSSIAFLVLSLIHI